MSRRLGTPEKVATTPVELSMVILAPVTVPFVVSIVIALPAPNEYPSPAKICPAADVDDKSKMLTVSAHPSEGTARANITTRDIPTNPVFSQWLSPCRWTIPFADFCPFGLTAVMLGSFIESPFIGKIPLLPLGAGPSDAGTFCLACTSFDLILPHRTHFGRFSKDMSMAPKGNSLALRYHPLKFLLKADSLGGSQGRGKGHAYAGLKAGAASAKFTGSRAPPQKD